MIRYDDFHSTAVAWLKVVLPLLALAILSTLFLFSRTIDPNDAIPFAEVDVEERLREPRLTAPTWAGVTDDGAALTVMATVARPQQNATQGASAESLTAVLETPDGGQVDLVAARGSLDTQGAVLTMQGGVVITTSTEYQLETDALIVALDQTSMISESPVVAHGPIGRIEAGAMEMRKDVERDGAYLLVFKNGVKMLYQPPK
ncbi:MAG: lipopolysaccharide export system protein LptC [Pseudorhodobacter sp.]|jgi:lipopolysaccharide export system protein LptC